MNCGVQTQALLVQTPLYMQSLGVVQLKGAGGGGGGEGGCGGGVQSTVPEVTPSL